MDPTPNILDEGEFLAGAWENSLIADFDGLTDSTVDFGNNQCNRNLIIAGIDETFCVFNFQSDRFVTPIGILMACCSGGMIIRIPGSVIFTVPAQLYFKFYLRMSPNLLFKRNQVKR